MNKNFSLMKSQWFKNLKKPSHVLETNFNVYDYMNINKTNRDMTKEVAEQLKGDYNSLKNDVERWRWLRFRKDDVIIELDNDWTGGILPYDGGQFDLEIDEYIGCSDGVMRLLDSLGLEHA